MLADLFLGCHHTLLGLFSNVRITEMDQRETLPWNNKMYSQLIAIIIGLTALIYDAGAVTREEIPACIQQVSYQLRNFQLHPILQLVLDRAFPDDGTVHDYDKEIDIKELTESICEDHKIRLSKKTRKVKCHQQFMDSDLNDEYSDAMQRFSSRHTRFCFLAAGICEFHKDNLNQSSSSEVRHDQDVPRETK